MGKQQVGKPKVLNRAMATKLKLEICAADSERGDENADLKDRAEWYYVTNGAFLVRVHHSMINDAAWKFFVPEKDDGSYRGYNQMSKADALERVLPDWLEVICPQAGGILEPVSIKKCDGKALPGVGKLAHFTRKGVAYFLPSGQVWLARNFWPSARFYIGATLVGVDLFGDEVKKYSPVIAATEEDGAVAAIMLMQEVM